MSQSTENIEARLCDYIEGELDEAGCAEIEKHLEANPPHRQLLADLMRTRAMVRELPRESAPAEILESLQGQLERSLLLQPDEEESAADLVLHVRRLPQFFAIAAMLLLAIGLAAVIYFVLPPADVQQPSELAVVPSADAVKDLRLPTEVISETPERSLRITDGESASRERPSASEIFTLSQNLPPLPGTFTHRREFGDVFRLSPGIASMHRRSGADSPAQGRLYVVVTTTDSRAANSELAEYLSSNRIQWQPAAREAMPMPVEMQQIMNAVALHYRRQAAPLKPPADIDAVEDQSRVAEAARRPGAAERSYDVRSRIPGTPSAKTGYAAAAPSAVAEAAKPTASSGVEMKGHVNVAEPSDETAIIDANAPAVASPNEEAILGQRPQQLAEVPQTSPPEGVVPDADGFVLHPNQAALSSPGLQEQQQQQQVIVVTNMTKRQVAELSDALTDRRAGQTAEVIDEALARATALPRYVGLTPTGMDPFAPEKSSVAGGAPTSRPTTLPSDAALDAAASELSHSDTATTQPLAVGGLTTEPSTQPMTPRLEGSASGGSRGGEVLDEPVDVVILVQEVADGSATSPHAEVPSTQPVHRDLSLQPTIP